jgi:hypothetical protein
MISSIDRVQVHVYSSPFSLQAEVPVHKYRHPMAFDADKPNTEAAFSIECLREGS